jgi:hypothetical protein
MTSYQRQLFFVEYNFLIPSYTLIKHIQADVIKP